MTEPLFQIGAEGVDVERLMAEIHATVERKMERGVYRDAQIAQAERTNLANLQSDEAFLRYYLDCLRNAVFIDINDFEIRERRRLGAGMLVAFKKILWKLLKFYTYRLWSQQNQVNGMLVTALEGLDEKYRNRLRDLERRLAAIEEEKAKSCRPPNA
ncbi:MAG: hypothetical protein NT011_04745 [Kiritimatiellaeota bacterium]|nr:hypothetical protein [Kiritimatiellota bacterium]